MQAAERPAAEAAGELKSASAALAAPAAGMERLDAIRQRIKQQQASLPPSGYSLVATQVSAPIAILRP